MKTKLQSILIGLVTLVVIESRAATDRFWTNTAGGNFNVTGNWFANVVPGAADNAYFTNNANYQVTWTASVTNANAFFNATSGSVTQAVGSFTWLLTNSYIVGQNAGTLATVTHSNGTLRVTNSVGTAILDVRRGTSRFNVGVIEADLLLLTNVAGAFVFNGGKLITRGAVISNGTDLVVGTSGTNPAVWDVRAGPGDHFLSGDLRVGNSASFNQLLVTNGMLLTNSGEGVLGYNAGANSNSAFLSGVNSRWLMVDNFLVGRGGAFNRLVISNGALVGNGFGILANLSTSSNNEALVTGTGSYWSNRNDVRVGDVGGGNRLEIGSGGLVGSERGFIGRLVTSSNNEVLVSGAGSLWSNRTDFFVGNLGSGNRLTVSNAATVLAAALTLGAGDSGTNNRLVVDGGTLRVTNATQNGALDIRRGTNQLNNSGLVETDLLRVTNTLGVFEFNGGTLNVRTSTVANGQSFFVGNGVSQAEFSLVGDGAHSVADGLTLRSNASLFGSGRISGTLSVQNGATLFPRSLVLSNSPSLAGLVFINLYMSGGFKTNYHVEVTGPITYGGRLIIDGEALGSNPLALGDRFQLFTASSYAGAFSIITLPSLASELAWTNKLSVDGSIEVLSAPPPTKVWDGGSSGLWNTAANWTGGVVPVDGDDLVFPASASRFVTTNNISGLDLNSITLSGSNYTIRGSLIGLTNGIIANYSSGSSTIDDTINLRGSQTFTCANAASLTLSDILSGGDSNGITKDGDGSLTLDVVGHGLSGNSYSGLTTINQGLVRVSGPTPFGSSSAGTVLNGGGISLGGNVIAEPLTNNSAASFITGSGTWGGDIMLNADLTVSVNSGSVSLYGVSRGVGGIIKTQPGLLSLDGPTASSYTGTTTVSAGTVRVNGSRLQSPVAIQSGGILGGTGTAGSVTASNGAEVNPGQGAASPAILTCSNVTFASSSMFTVDLRGTSPGSNYDQLKVNGAVNLGNATLNISFGSFVPTNGTSFTIIDNDGADAVTGTFNALPEGATLNINNRFLRISYTNGTGNDVTLTFFSPLAILNSQVSAGNGNHAIDANECNNLELVLTNTFGSPLSNITATLSSPTPGIMIMQPQSAYSNIAANGTRTNTTLFQISTLPYFVCDSTIELDLTVTASNFTFLTQTTIPTAPGCPDGGGVCGVCPGNFVGSIANTDLSTSVRLFISSAPSSCAQPTPCPGQEFAGGLLLYDLYQFTNNSPSNACVTVSLTPVCGDSLYSAAFLNFFDDTFLCNSYLADGGVPVSSGGTRTYSFPVPAGAVFLVMVSEYFGSFGAGCTNYTLVVSGLECPSPALAIQSVSTNKVRLTWPTTAGGYNLESTPSLAPTNWIGVTNEPIVVAPNYNVTNSTGNPEQFYRLRKPQP